MDSRLKQLINCIADWNEQRYPQQYDHGLTTDLLFEELQETKEAHLTEDDVEYIDGLADVFFVAVGALWKCDNLDGLINTFIKGEQPAPIHVYWNMPRHELSNQLSKSYRTRLSYLAISAYQALIEYLGSSKYANKAIQIVCISNKTKPVVKTDPTVKANIDKGADFVPPTEGLKALLQKVKGIADSVNAPSESIPKDLLAKFQELALTTAAKSPCKKRKVGAVLAADEHTYTFGFNYAKAGKTCEDSAGHTTPDVIHAEVKAIQAWKKYCKGITPKWLIVTHQPCADCMSELIKLGITPAQVYIANAFMKFDGEKPRMDLVPPSAVTALAEVLTYGARKYKPNNWLEVDDVGRYVAAAERHFLAFKNGEKQDPESGLSHLAHAICNLAFLIELEQKGKSFHSPFGENQ